MTDKDDARLCRWREGADKMLESDSGWGVRVERHQTLSTACHPAQVKRGLSSCLSAHEPPPLPLPDLTSRAHFRSAEFGRKTGMLEGK